MQVHFRWEVSSADADFGVTVYSDTGNRNMYLVDSLGNRLDHFETGGDANNQVGLWDGDAKYGWFLFPAPNPAAEYFVFHDDDNHLLTDRIPKEWD